MAYLTACNTLKGISGSSFTLWFEEEALPTLQREEGLMGCTPELELRGPSQPRVAGEATPFSRRWQDQESSNQATLPRVKEGIGWRMLEEPVGRELQVYYGDAWLTWGEQSGEES